MPAEPLLLPCIREVAQAPGPLLGLCFLGKGQGVHMEVRRLARTVSSVHGALAWASARPSRPTSSLSSNVYTWGRNKIQS